MKIFLKTGLTLCVTEDEGREVAFQFYNGKPVILVHDDEGEVILAVSADQIVAILDNLHTYGG